jgi:putative ABC transport system permease protein
MDGTVLLVVLVAIIFIIVGILALRSISFGKIAARNLGRRRRSTAIVVTGLLVGTAIVTSSLVIGDTMEFIFENTVYQQLWTIDELVHTPPGNQTAGELFSYFPESDYQNLSQARGLGQMPNVDALVPSIFETAPLINTATQISEPMVNLWGVEPEASKELGDFKSVSGGTIDEESVLSIPNDVIINERLADSTDAQVGDYVVIFHIKFNSSYPAVPNAFPEPRTFHVAEITKNEGKANFLNGMNIFIELDQLQALLHETDRINLIAVSNEGGVQTGAEHTKAAVAEIENALGPEGRSRLEVEAVKQENLDFVSTASEMIAEVFWIMGIFSIVAGIILVINIFVMLAEERKPEMGVSRALGMKKVHLIQTYLFEGSAYALIAAFLGTFVGLFIAYVMISAFGAVFGGADFGAAGRFEIPFHFETESLILGFSIGVIITFLTVLLASWVVSRLNIVRAIRSIPEPVGGKPSLKLLVVSFLLIVIGILLTYQGYVQLSGGLFYTGPCLFLLGGGLAATRWFRPRIAYSVSSALILFWTLAPIEWVSDMESGMEMFVLSGLFLVLAAILLLMMNSSLLLRILTRILASRRRTVPVMRIALSYPMKKRFRTGMTLAMFALIIFTVTVIAMISSFQANSVESTFLEEAGGYDIIGLGNPNNPIPDIKRSIASSPTLAGGFDEVSSLSWNRVPAYAKDKGPDTSFTNNMYGADDDFLDNNDFTFHSIMEGYDSPKEVWDALRTNPTKIVVDGTVGTTMEYGPEMIGGLSADVGDEVIIQHQSGPINMTIIGIMDQSLFFQGMIVSNDTATQLFGHQSPFAYFFTASDSDPENVRDLTKDLRREFIGLSTVNIKGIISDFLEIASSIMNLFQVYLGLGLVVGIAGLGIITVRSVVERTNEIGVMRAIGYKRKMIRNTFILEISFISVLGITVGVLLGVALSYYIYGDFFGETGSFSDFLSLIPYVNLILITLIALIFTLLATISSAFRASRIIPAEALRFKE